MAKILQKCVKYTTKELEQYVATDGSCVRKVTNEMHISMGPYGLADFKHALHAHLVRTKVGFYDGQLNGIILDLKNIKVLDSKAAIRGDDPIIHFNIKADFYVFRPEVGNVISGVVKHVSKNQIGVIIYRVFNATIRLSTKLNKDAIQMNEDINFRIKDFDLQNVFPYIEGEILPAETQKSKFKKFDASSLSNEADSGIEERDSTNEKSPLDELVALIKDEPTSEADTPPTTPKKKKRDKLKRSINETELSHEKSSETKKKRKKDKSRESEEVSTKLSNLNNSNELGEKVKNKKIKVEKIS